MIQENARSNSETQTDRLEILRSPGQNQVTADQLQETLVFHPLEVHQQTGATQEQTNHKTVKMKDNIKHIWETMKETPFEERSSIPKMKKRSPTNRADQP